MEIAKKGDRIQLIRTTDEYTDLQPGELGTVTMVYDGTSMFDGVTVYVNWDNGSTLGLIYEAGDRFTIVGHE